MTLLSRTAAPAVTAALTSARLHVLDLGPPRTAFERGLAYLFRFSERARDNVDGRLPEIARQAGFADAREIERLSSLIGGVTLITASSGSAPAIPR